MKYTTATHATLDEDKDLFFCYVFLNGERHSAVFGNTPQTAIQNAKRTVDILNNEIVPTLR